MNIIISTLIVVLIILLLTLLSIWLDRKAWVKFAETVFDKICTLIDSKLESVTDQCKAVPWYLVVYTQDSNYPIWISNNTIRIVQPDPANNKIIVKQFNGEDMVIENVINYELCSASDMCEYDM